MQGRSEPGRSVRQGPAKAGSHQECRRGRGSGISVFPCALPPRPLGLPLGRFVVRGRAVYSSRLHSRSIDSIRGIRPLVPYGGGNSGRLSWGPRSQEVAPDAPCLIDHPASRGKLGRRSASGSALADDFRHLHWAGIPTGRRLKRRLQMRLASPTSPAHVAVPSDIMKRVFQQTAR